MKSFVRPNLASIAVAAIGLIFLLAAVLRVAAAAALFLGAAALFALALVMAVNWSRGTAKPSDPA